jgi:hypothetical protein
MFAPLPVCHFLFLKSLDSRFDDATSIGLPAVSWRVIPRGSALADDGGICTIDSNSTLRWTLFGAIPKLPHYGHLQKNGGRGEAVCGEADTNSFRITSLSYPSKELPWNHIVVKNIGGGGVGVLLPGTDRADA